MRPTLRARAPRPRLKSARSSRFSALWPWIDIASLRRSAEAVQVVETSETKRRTADLGEVLARAQGVGVQRAGGLGSDTCFSLNGLTDDQIRFFLDEIPLEFAGYPFGIANVPINLVERVEIYRGVVPIRFGPRAGKPHRGGRSRYVRGHGCSSSQKSSAFRGSSSPAQRRCAIAPRRSKITSQLQCDSPEGGGAARVSLAIARRLRLRDRGQFVRECRQYHVSK